MTTRDAADGARWQQALLAIERSIDTAWAAALSEHPGEPADFLARSIFDDPASHDWRLVEAALEHMTCENGHSPLGGGPKGCWPCDYADGLRFRGREVDREGAPPGNEHAIRVSSAVLRAQHRYPDWSVAGNRLHLPLFIDGQMPTREQQEAMLRAVVARPMSPDDLELAPRARTFVELAALIAGRG